MLRYLKSGVIKWQKLDFSKIPKKKKKKSPKTPSFFVQFVFISIASSVLKTDLSMVLELVIFVFLLPVNT